VRLLKPIYRDIDIQYHIDKEISIVYTLLFGIEL